MEPPEQVIFRRTVVSPVQSGASARYSGDISSWTWTQSGQGAKSYGFTYDGARRLTAGQYYMGSGTSASSTNALSEKSISYDVNGNVTSDATNSLQSSYNLINLLSCICAGAEGGIIIPIHIRTRFSLYWDRLVLVFFVFGGLLTCSSL